MSTISKIVLGLMRVLQRFNLTKQYYSLDYGNVHFLALSSEVPFDKDSKQYSFVSEDLKSATGNKSINWIVAYIYEMLSHFSQTNRHYTRHISSYL